MRRLAECGVTIEKRGERLEFIDNSEIRVPQFFFFFSDCFDFSEEEEAERWRERF